jgi:superoxide dismutase, Cu-Zn family
MLHQSCRGVFVATLVAGFSFGCMPEGDFLSELEAETEQPIVGVANAIMRDGAGNQVALVRFGVHSAGTRVQVTATGLTTGIHAFHVHANNDPANGDGCIGPDFLSADGHYNPAGLSHPNHAGDMPVLFFGPGTPTFGHANFVTGNFNTEEIKGRAVILHALADNCANIPTRYSAAGVPGPDAATLATGDAGGRVACGLITE